MCPLVSLLHGPVWEPESNGGQGKGVPCFPLAAVFYIKGLLGNSTCSWKTVPRACSAALGLHLLLSHSVPRTQVSSWHRQQQEPQTDALAGSSPWSPTCRLRDARTWANHLISLSLSFTSGNRGPYLAEVVRSKWDKCVKYSEQGLAHRKHLINNGATPTFPGFHLALCLPYSTLSSSRRPHLARLNSHHQHPHVLHEVSLLSLLSLHSFSVNSVNQTTGLNYVQYSPNKYFMGLLNTRVGWRRWSWEHGGR